MWYVSNQQDTYIHKVTQHSWNYAGSICKICINALLRARGVSYDIPGLL